MKLSLNIKPLTKAEMKAIAGGDVTESYGKCYKGGEVCNSNVQCCSNKCVVSANKITGYACKGDKP